MKTCKIIGPVYKYSPTKIMKGCHISSTAKIDFFVYSKNVTDEEKIHNNYVIKVVCDKYGTKYIVNKYLCDDKTYPVIIDEKRKYANMQNNT